MYTVYFFENRSLVLCQLLNSVPSVNVDVKIKGRKGKVLSVNEVEENLIHVQVLFEKVVKAKTLANNNKKKKR